MRINLLRVVVLCLVLFAPQAQLLAQAPGDAELEALNGRVAALIQSGKYPDALPLAEQYAAAVKARFGDSATQYAAALNTLAVLLGGANRFAEAEALMRQALAIDEQASGPNHPNVAMRLHSLALFLQIRNRLAEAEPLMRRALEISEKSHGPDAAETAAVLASLAGLLREENRLAEAEPLVRRALAIAEKSDGPDNPSVLPSLNLLARLLQDTNRQAEAEPLMRRALAIAEKNFGPDHPIVLTSLGQLAALLRDLNRFEEAEILMRRALAVAEKAYGPDHAIVATNLNNLAGLLKETNRLAEAEPLMRRALAITEKSLGPDHPNVAGSLDNLAALLQITNRMAEAEPLLRRALQIDEKTYGPNHPNVAIRLGSLAGVLQATNRLAAAEPLMRRALEIDEKSYGPNHPNVAIRLTALALLLQTTNRSAEAEPLMRRALDIDEKGYGPDHTNVAIRLTGLAVLLQAGNRFAEAEPLLRRSLAIFEKAYGPDHPNVAISLTGLAQLLQSTNRFVEAEPLLRRALAIHEKSYGPDSLFAGITLNNLAQLLQTTNRLEEAEPLMRRVIAVLEKTLGPDHPLFATSLNNLAALKEEQDDWTAAAALYARAKPIMTGALKATATDRSLFGKAVLTRRSGNLKSYVRALYRANAASVTNRTEGFEVAQWALQNDAAGALSSMALRFANGEGRLANLVREEQDLQAARENAYRQLDQAAGQANASAAAAARAAIATIGSKLHHTKAVLRHDYKDYAELASPQPLGIAEAQALLSGGQALLLFLDLPQYSKVPEETVLFAVTRTQARWIGLPIGTEALRQRVTRLRCGLDNTNWRFGEESREVCQRLLGASVSDEETPPFDAAAAYALYRDLFGGVEDLIKDKSLLLVPSGPLTQLPFEALVTEKPDETLPRFEAYKKARWLGQRQAITVLPSVGSLQALRSAKGSRAPEPYIGVGNPLLDGVSGTDKSAWAKQTCSKSPTPARTRIASRTSVPPSIFRDLEVNVEGMRHQPPLPETADELCQAAQALGVPEADLGHAVYLGGRATVTQVKALSKSGDLAKARVVHFATHGLLAGETALFAAYKAEPALLLTPPRAGEASADDNGLLTASEIAQLNLNADWVIMSACNTAAGSSEGAEALSGLARAFFYAGARSLLVSHWEVNSDAAVAITTGAMNAMKAEPGIGRAEALRRSISALIARGRGWDHPSLWAPFVLAGNGER